MENRMTKYLVIVHFFVDLFGSRDFAGSLEYVIDCISDTDLLDKLDKLKAQAIKDYCGEDVDRKQAYHVGIHQVSELINRC
jgi:hypothetical protein